MGVQLPSVSGIGKQHGADEADEYINTLGQTVTP
jgi:hypothetical protein